MLLPRREIRKSEKGQWEGAILGPQGVFFPEDSGDPLFLKLLNKEIMMGPRRILRGAAFDFGGAGPGFYCRAYEKRNYQRAKRRDGRQEPGPPIGPGAILTVGGKRRVSPQQLQSLRNKYVRRVADDCRGHPAMAGPLSIFFFGSYLARLGFLSRRIQGGSGQLSRSGHFTRSQTKRLGEAALGAIFPSTMLGTVRVTRSPAKS